MAHPPRTRSVFRSVVLPVTGAVVVAGVVAVVWLIPSNEDLALRAAAIATERLGVPVTVGSLHWQVFPSPQVHVEDVTTDQPQPVQLRRLTAHPELASLLRGRVVLERLDLDGAVVPQLSLRALGQKDTAGVRPIAMAVGDTTAVPVAHVSFRDVQWISRTGIAVTYEGEADFDPQWRPRHAQLRRPGFSPATSLTLTRLDGADRWRTEILLGGGTAHGEVELKTVFDGGVHLTGQLTPQAVEVQNALAAFNRKSPVSGKASGKTTLSAQGGTVGQLAQSLHTQTIFTMAPATLVKFDLSKAIRTLGADHAGTTPIDSLSGQLDTQNTPNGMVSRFTQVKAKSGALSASGEATLAQQQIDATFAVDLIDGVVGVPLRVEGPVKEPRFSVPGGAVAGAALGTAVLPGVGTAIGARVGGLLGKLFGNETPAAPQGKASGPASKPSAKPQAVVPAEDPNKLWR